ncbi:MAG: MarR family transcriptional regulator [Halobacteriales archaeon]
MPVRLDGHDPDLDLDPTTTKARLVAFLYQHPELGFRPAELQAELDIPHGTATATLARLRDAGYIGKTPDSYYHALPDRDELDRYAAAFEQVVRLTERFAERPAVEAEQTTPRDEQLDSRPVGASAASVEAELDALDEAVDDSR